MSRTLHAVPVGNSIKLDCSSKGIPRPSVVWFKNGNEFKSRKDSPLILDRYQYVLNLKDVVPSDSGQYTCNVSNPYGWINHTYKVDVHRKYDDLHYDLISFRTLRVFCWSFVPKSDCTFRRNS